MRSEARNQKRKEAVEAVILRKEPATLVARVHNVTNRTYSNGYQGIGMVAGRH